MFYDQTRKPTPNGDFELINGKLVLRDGRHLHLSPLLLRDGMPTNLSDAERAQCDVAIARARMDHDLTNAWRGAAAPAWTADQEVLVVQDTLAALGSGRSGAAHDVTDTEIADARAAMLADLRDQAFNDAGERERNAWRNAGVR